MKHKLIMICGMSGTGKSTTAQNVARQFKLNNIAYHWLHEESRDHPIRNGEFSKGSLSKREGTDANVADMYERWQRLTGTIQDSHVPYIMEGCYFQSIIRYFIGSAYSTEQMLQYYDNVSGILAPTNPLLVFLYRPDIKANFEAVYGIRGEWWKNLILSPDTDGYFANHPYQGDESIYAMWAEYQGLSQSVFDRFTGTKLKVDTSNGMWNDHIRSIVETAGLPYQQPPAYALQNPEKYCGVFSVNQNGEAHNLDIRYDAERHVLYAVSFWPYMEINPIGVDVFEMASFPIEIAYEFSDDRKLIHVSGSYDWDIVGTTMEERPSAAS